MKSQLTVMQRLRLASWSRYLLIAISGLYVVGVGTATSAEELVSYIAITTLALMPGALWLWAGAPGIPAWPVSSGLYYLYYAVPLLRGNLAYGGLFSYSGTEILNVGLTVTLFLLTATSAWWIILSSRHRAQHSAAQELVAGRALTQIIFCGLGLGIFYFVTLNSFLVSLVGQYLGIVRSVTLTATFLACFLLGNARAVGVLQGRQWILAVSALCMVIALTLSSLFLIGGLMFMLTAVLGYALTAKKIPWKMVVTAFVIAAILHSGKTEMRKRYWGAGTNYDAQFSLDSLPARMVEWTEVGLREMGSSEKSSSVIDRAALVHLLLRVQQLAPNIVPFLNGDTYALLPGMLIPRFVEAGKTTSQASMRMLNVRFGFQSEQATNTTAIGWGLISEAYANFGNFGVVAIALIIGIFGGLLARLSDGQPATSLPSLIAISGLVILVNLESDFSYLVVNFAQSLGALLIFYAAMRPFLARTRRRRARAAVVQAT